jgi:hypothetical protein
MEDTIEVILKKGNKAHERKCVLFNDLLLCVKPKKNGYGSPVMMPLNTVRFIEISDTDSTCILLLECNTD